MTVIMDKKHLDIKRQRPCALWLTGFSGAGKSTIASLTERELLSLGYRTYLLDGDIVRKSLCKDLGFSPADRNENIRRIGAVAKLFTDAGFIVLVATISPFQQMRSNIRALFSPGEFIEIFIDAPLAVCEQRDPKGLYRRARAGEISDFTGIHSAYDPPQTPELHLCTHQNSPEICTASIMAYLYQHEYLSDERQSQNRD